MRLPGDESRLPQALLAALVVLLPLLAFLQYRWIGRLSEAEHERMQNNLRATLERFEQDFDTELARIPRTFQVGPSALEDYAQRLAHWRESALYPDLVRHVYATEGGDHGLKQFLVLGPDGRHCSPPTGPPSLPPSASAWKPAPASFVPARGFGISARRTRHSWSSPDSHRLLVRGHSEGRRRHPPAAGCSWSSTSKTISSRISPGATSGLQVNSIITCKLLHKLLFLKQFINLTRGPILGSGCRDAAF